MTTTATAALTIVDDGQTRWAANTADLIAVLRDLSYSAEQYQGHLTLVETQETKARVSGIDDEPTSADVYGHLCNSVSPVHDDYEMKLALRFERGELGDDDDTGLAAAVATATSHAESMTYRQDVVSDDRWFVSPALFAAVNEERE